MKFKPLTPASSDACSARNRSRSLRLILMTGLLAFLTLQTAHALPKSALKGTLEDSTGFPIPGVDVKVKNLADGKEIKASSDEEGFFAFPDLPPGKYELNIATPGFEEFTQPVEIGATPLKPLRIQLKIAEVKEKITVSSHSPHLSLAPQQNSDVLQMDQNSFHNVPIKDGDPLAIPSLFLDPASVGAHGPQLIVDGVPTSSLDVPTAAVRDVSINRDPYSAEFERPGSGRIEVTTRQGSHHRYRGQIDFLLRNSALDARNPFAQTVPELQRGILDGQLSGPLTKHLSFFAAGRYYSNNQASVVNALTDAGPFVDNFMAPTRTYYGFGRLDYARHGRHMSVLYKYKDKSKRGQNVGGFNLPSAATDEFDQENEVKFYDTEILSDHSLNDARFTFKRQPQGVASLNNAPALIVPGSFVGGGAQLSQGLTDTMMAFEDIASYNRGKHVLRFGGEVRPRFFSTYDTSNFGGTFFFSSLAAFKAGKPFLYRQNHGEQVEPQENGVSFDQEEFFTFIQDEFRVRPSFSLSLGVRHQFQTNAADYDNLAPRLSLAYAPDGGRTVIRAGAGVFYDRLPELMTEQSLLFDARHIRQVVIQNPTYPNPFGATGVENEKLETPSLTRIAPGLVLPYVVQENVSIERQLGAGRNILTLNLLGLRGVHLYRMRNVNAPLPGALVPPNPNFINIDQYESSGQSRSYSASLTYQSTIKRRLDLMVQYVLSKSLDDTPGILPSSTTSLLFFPVTQDALFPADQYDMTGEWGRSNFDRRQRFNLVGYYRMPWGFKSGAVISLSSGIPYNITTGTDSNHDNVLNDRPPGVGRNTGHGPSYADVDFHLGKEFRLLQVGETARMEWGADAFNLFNTVNYKDYVGVITSRYFGHANAAQGARTLQMSFRFKF